MNDIIIFSARVARDLVQKKFELNDIKADKYNKIKSVFYFKNTQKLREYLKLEHNIEIK